MAVVTFLVPGTIRANERHRSTRDGRQYTPQQTKEARHEVQLRYMAACRGRRFGDRPVGVTVVAMFQRPQSHRLKDGTLSAVGRRSLSPTKRPDGDNIGKLVLDGLNGVAWDDDAQVVALHVHKRWCIRGEEEGMMVWVADTSNAEEPE